jgi:hypothetical protein
MSLTWLRQLRARLLAGPDGARPARRRPRSVPPAVEFLETRDLLSYTAGLIGGGLIGDPPDPPPPRGGGTVHSTVIREDSLTSLVPALGDTNQPYSGAIANFGSASAVLRMVSGLPAGLTATKSGSTILFSGTPTLSGPYSVGVETLDQVIDSNGNTYNTWYEGSYNLTIDPALTLGGLSGTWTAGHAGSAAIAVGGGTPAYSNLTVTGLPPGLTAALSGNTITLSGTPTRAGTFGNVVVSLQDSLGATVSQTYSLAVGLGLTPGTLPAEVDGQVYSVPLGATGGSGSYSFALASGSLPTGLSLSPAGLLSGTATGSPGPWHFTVRVTDNANAGLSGTQAYVLMVNPATATRLVISAPASVSAGSTFQVGVTALDAYGNGVDGVPVTLGGVTVVTAYGTGGHGDGYASFNLTAPTAAGMYTLTASAPGLPTGTASYTVVGAYPRGIVVSPSTTTPNADNSFNVHLTLVDYWGNASPYTGTITLTSSDGQLAPTTATANNGVADASVALHIASSLTLNAVYGPLTAGTSGTITVQAGAARSLAFIVQPPSSVVAGNPFSATVQVKDGWGNAKSGVPVGISISPGMLSSGATPIVTNASGQAVFNLTENVAGGYVLNASVAGLASVASNSFTVTPGPVASVVVSPSTMTPTSGVGFNVTVTAKDANNNGALGTIHLTSSDPLFVPPADYTLTSADNGSHTFNITLKTPGSQSITATVGGASGSANVTVSAVMLTLSQTTVPAATVGQSYSQTFSATGGSGSFAFAVASGAPPKGLSLSSAGVLSGTTFLPGTYNFTVKVTDKNNAAATTTRAYTLTVSRAQGSFTSVSLTTSNSSKGNVTATVSGNSMSPTVDFHITGTPSGTHDTGAVSMVDYAISPNGRVAVVIPPLVANPVVALYNLGFDASQGGSTAIGSQIWNSALAINWHQFWFSPDDSLLVIIGNGGTASVFTAALFNTVTGQQIGPTQSFTAGGDVTGIVLGKDSMNRDTVTVSYPGGPSNPAPWWAF